MIRKCNKKSERKWKMLTKCITPPIKTIISLPNLAVFDPRIPNRPPAAMIYYYGITVIDTFILG